MLIESLSMLMYMQVLVQIRFSSISQLNIIEFAASLSVIGKKTLLEREMRGMLRQLKRSDFVLPSNTQHSQRVKVREKKLLVIHMCWLISETLIYILTKFKLTAIDRLAISRADLRLTFFQTVFLSTSLTKLFIPIRKVIYY